MNRLLLAAFLLAPSACATAPTPKCPDFDTKVTFRGGRTAEVIWACAFLGDDANSELVCLPYEVFQEALRAQGAGGGNKHSL